MSLTKVYILYVPRFFGNLTVAFWGPEADYEMSDLGNLSPLGPYDVEFLSVIVRAWNRLWRGEKYVPFHGLKNLCPPSVHVMGNFSVGLWEPEADYEGIKNSKV